MKGETITAVAGECEFCLCDDRWHTVTAEYQKNVVTLQVDGGRMGVGATSVEDQALNTNYPLYIGGYPGECYITIPTIP